MLILLAVLSASCDRSPDAEPDGEVVDGSEAPAEVYHRSLLFMAEPGIDQAELSSAAAGIRDADGSAEAAADLDPPFGMVLDSEVRVRGERSRRLLRAWLSHPGQWQRVAPGGWIAAPARGALRLMPSGPIRVAVSDNGRLESVILRLEPEATRVELGGPLGNWSPHPRVRLLLRRATLETGGESTGGLLLDLESDAGSENGARPPELGFLTDGEELALVLFGISSGTPSGWLRHGADSEPWENIRIERQEIEGGAAWRVLGGEETLGELWERGAADEEAPDGAIAAPIMLTGWILVDGERRDVAGFMRTSP